jgi:hypothetical protein
MPKSLRNASEPTSEHSSGGSESSGNSKGSTMSVMVHTLGFNPRYEWKLVTWFINVYGNEEL